MPMKEEHRQKMLLTTRDAAAALIEDLEHIRYVLRLADLSRGDLRRLSSVLRRLLVDRDLTIVAAPRLGRFLFRAPDNKPAIKLSEKNPFLFFGTAGVEFPGVQIRDIALNRGLTPTPSGSNPERMVHMRLDGFLSQPVLCFERKWASRGDTIKFSANVASGVHSGTPTDAQELLLARMRQRVNYVLAANAIAINMRLETLGHSTEPLAYDPGALDPLLVELLSTAHFIAISSHTMQLEAIIRQELSLPRSRPS